MTPEEERKLVADQLRAATDARFVLDNPVFIKAKEEIYGKLRLARKNLLTHAPPEQIADLVRVEQIADQFFDYFDLVLQTGKMAADHMEQESARQSLKERGLAMWRNIGRNSF